MLPNTLIVGVQKAGTTTLHDWLSQHPDIYAPNALKDVEYFSADYDEKEVVEKLNNDFKGHENESVILQTYVNYMLYDESLKQINKILPDVKIIVIFRDPVDRAISAYRYFVKMKKEKRSMEEALIYKPKEIKDYSEENNNFTYIEHGLYGKQLQTLCSIFKKENILLLNFDDLSDKPKEILNKVYRFINVDFYLPNLSEKNKTGSVRFDLLNRFVLKPNKFKKLFIRTLIDWWLPPKKRKLIRQWIIELNTMKKNNNDSDIPPKVLKHLKNVFEEDQKLFKELSGGIRS